MIRILCTDISCAGSETVERLYALASAERKARADRYRRQEDRLRCLAADALLRYAVGGFSPAVAQGPHGKPFLPELPDFHFNLSHAGSWVVLAHGKSELGVDVEQTNRNVDADGIAARQFTEDEQAHLLCHPEDFFRIWTAKESYLKYLGTGLTRSTKSFSVLPGASPSGVRFHSLRPDSRHLLTLCAPDNGEAIETVFVPCDTVKNR